MQVETVAQTTVHAREQRIMIGGVPDMQDQGARPALHTPLREEAQSAQRVAIAAAITWQRGQGQGEVK